MKFHHVLALAFLALATPALAQNNLTVKGAVTAGHCVTFVNKFQLQDGGTCSAAAGGAPADATYITQTANSTLSAEQAMGALATGIVKNTTTTGAQSIAVEGTDYIGTASTGASGHKLPYLDVVNTWSAAQTASANPAFFVTNSSDQTGIASATTTTLTWATENSDVGSKFASNEWCPGWTGSVQLNVILFEITGTVTVGSGPLVELQKGTTGAETTYQYGPNVRAPSASTFGGMAFSITDVATSTTCYRLRLTASTTAGTITVSHFSSFSGRAF